MCGQIIPAKKRKGNGKEMTNVNEMDARQEYAINDS